MNQTESAMPRETQGYREYLLLAGWTLFFLLIRTLFIGSTMVVDDEAYYYVYSQHLAGGYIDHGPVIAYVIKISTLLFGENSFGVRAGGVLLMSLLPLFGYVFGVLHSSSRTGWVLFWLLNTTLFFFANSIILTPDLVMIFFMTMAVMAYFLAFFREKKFFYPAGILLGLSFLSKISVLFPAVGIVLFPLVSRKYRGMLRQKEFWISLVLAFLVFLPFIVWNIQNDLAFVKYQGGHISKPGKISTFFEVWGAQAGILFPVLFFFSLYLPIQALTARFKKKESEEYLFLGLVTLVPLAYFAVHSFLFKYNANWPFPTFFGGILLAGIHFSTHHERLKIPYRVQVIASAVLCAAAVVHTLYPLVPVIKKDPTNRYYTYRPLRDDLPAILSSREDLQGLRIISNNFQVPSMVNLYLKPDKESLCLSIDYHPTLYNFLYPDRELTGKDYLFLWYEPNFPGHLRDHFQAIEEVAVLPAVRKGTTIMELGLWKVSGYKGKQIPQ